MGLGLSWGRPSHQRPVLAPGPVAFVPLIGGLVGGSQVQSEAQVGSQEQAQDDDKAQQEDNPWKSQEQVLGQRTER